MYYVVLDDTAYCLDNSEDTLYFAPVKQNEIMWDDTYDITEVNLTEDEHEYVAHVAYHLQRIAKLTEEQTKVFVK